MLSENEIPYYELLLSDITNCKKLRISLYPEDTSQEKYYKYKDYKSIDTLTGKLLLLNLIDEDGKEVIFSLPDIVSIDCNNNSNSDYEKYYIEIMIRSIYIQYLKLKEINPLDKELHELKEGSTSKYRIELFYN